MGRVLKMARRKISLACGNLCCPTLFISFARTASVYCEEYVYTHTHIYDYVKTVCELSLVLNNIAMKHFYSNRDRREVLTGCLSLGYRLGGDWVNT